MKLKVVIITIIGLVLVLVSYLYLTRNSPLLYRSVDQASVEQSGFIIQNRDEIPKQKETFTVGNYQFDILNVSDTRIETVKMKVLR